MESQEYHDPTNQELGGTATPAINTGIRTLGDYLDDYARAHQNNNARQQEGTGATGTVVESPNPNLN